TCSTASGCSATATATAPAARWRSSSRSTASACSSRSCARASPTTPSGSTAGSPTTPGCSRASRSAPRSATGRTRSGCSPPTPPDPRPGRRPGRAPPSPPGGDDLLGLRQRLDEDARQVLVPALGEDRVVDAALGEAPGGVHDLGHRRRAVEAAERGLLDLGVVAPLAVAVRAQHVPLAGQLGSVEEVAGVGVLRHEPQRLPLPAAADQDRRMRPAQRGRGVQLPLQGVVAAPERRLVAVPHPAGDPQRLL